MRDFSNHASDRPAGHDVEITGIEAAVVEGNFEWNLVTVHTDAGVTGIGEAYRGGGVPELVEYANRFLVGENPLDVERLFRRLVQEMSGHGGTTGKVVTAASGIEIALWDAAGKILDLPVYQLLGSRYRDRVRIYCDCHAGEAYAVDDGGATEYADADAYTPEAYAAEAERVVDMGFDAIKFDLDTPQDTDPDPYNGRLTNAAVNHKVAVVDAVRDAVGDEIDLAFDCHWDYTVESASRPKRANSSPTISCGSRTSFPRGDGGTEGGRPADGDAARNRRESVPDPRTERSDRRLRGRRDHARSDDLRRARRVQADRRTRRGTLYPVLTAQRL